MSTMMANVEKFEDRYLQQVKEIEEPVIRFTGEASERLARFVPERPRFMADLPKFGEVVDNQLKFQKRVVDQQMRFVRKMMKAMDPMLEKVDAEPKRVTVTKAEPVQRQQRRTTRKAA